MIQIDINFKQIVGVIQFIGGLISLFFSYFFHNQLDHVAKIDNLINVTGLAMWGPLESIFLIISVGLLIFGISQILQGLVNIRND